MIPAMTISEAVTIPKGVILKGAKAGTAANSGDRASDTIDSDETIFSQPVTIEDGSQIDGVTLTAKPVINTADEATIKNSKILNITTTATDHAAAAVINPNQWGTPVKLVVEGNYFGTNTGVYNVFEINAPLADGSSISDNYFAAAAGSHNIINIYAVDDYSNVKINNNHFEKSANAIRIGTKGDVKKSVINVENNAYDTTDSDTNYAGLIIVQPYGTATKSMGDLRINVNNTTNNSGVSQLVYYFANPTDAQLDYVNKPSVYIDGIKLAEADFPIVA